jgi:hypothetical protein
MPDFDTPNPALTYKTPVAGVADSHLIGNPNDCSTIRVLRKRRIRREVDVPKMSSLDSPKPVRNAVNLEARQLLGETGDIISESSVLESNLPISATTAETAKVVVKEFWDAFL